MTKLSGGLVCAVALLLAVGAGGCASAARQAAEKTPALKPARPAAMPVEIGRALTDAGSSLFRSGVHVIVRVPERRMPKHLALRSLPTGESWVLAAKETTFTPHAFAGFRVASTEPTASAALGATQTVVLVAGPHPGTVEGTPWVLGHPATVKSGGATQCYDAENGGTQGCHSEHFCSDCHTELMSR